MHGVPFFSRPGAIGMPLDAGAVQAHGLPPDLDHPRPLPMREPAVQNPVLRPPVQARVDGVAVAEGLRPAAPLAAVLGHVENGVEYRQVREADMAPRPRQQRGHALVLCPCQFHGLFPRTVPVENHGHRVYHVWKKLC